MNTTGCAVLGVDLARVAKNVYSLSPLSVFTGQIIMFSLGSMKITRLYEWFLIASLATSPSAMILYLYLFQDASLLFDNHLVHELVIAAAIVISAFVSFVTFFCYRASGEVVLRWLTLAFLGFTLIYAPHGIFTRMSQHHMLLFLYFGPVSRLVMACLLFRGLFSYGLPPEPAATRCRVSRWAGWTLFFLGIDMLIGEISLGSWACLPLLRATEFLALAMSLASMAYIVRNQLFSPMMQVYCLSLACFAQSSLAFLLATPWNHLWWLAHFIFGAGFLLLSYGVVRAFHTTRTFSGIYSQEEILHQLRQANQTAVAAVERLQFANKELERLASTDPLTGACNRREFLVRAQVELARAGRAESPVSLLAMDLDHFKRINDTHGHAMGDAVLVGVVAEIKKLLRAQDVMGRMGGEEFLIVLPGADKREAARVAERVRSAVEAMIVRVDTADTARVTVSVGVAQFGQDGRTLEDMMRAADGRLYCAKRQGRNQVAV